jgi:hypothetical protein
MYSGVIIIIIIIIFIKRTIIIRTDKETAALTRRNALLQGKHARGQRPDALLVEDRRRGGRGAGKGNFDGEAVAGDAGFFVEGCEAAGVGEGIGGRGDVPEGGLDEDAAGEVGDVAGG